MSRGDRLTNRLSEVIDRLEVAGRRWEHGEDDQTTLTSFAQALTDLTEVRAALQHGVDVSADEAVGLAAQVTAALDWVQTAQRTPTMPVDMAVGLARLREVLDQLSVLAGGQGGYGRRAGDGHGC
jgi:hypothetical protein